MEENNNVVEENKIETNENQNNNEQPKNNKKPISYMIVAILIIVAFVGGFLVSNLLNLEKKESNNSENIENKNEEKDDNKNEEKPVDNQVDYTITKEETEDFLNKYGDYLYVLKNDEYDESQIFYMAISYLAHSKMYTKTDDVFNFKESDIKDLVRILYMKDTIKYGGEGLAAKYDAENQTIGVSIHMGLHNEDPGPEKTVTKTIKDFKFENGIAELTYNINEKYNEIVHDQTGQVINESNIDYLIKLYKVDNELRIKDISSNRYSN